MKFRHRVKGTSLGRRIPKGKSSESNPSITRHRKAARAARIFEKASSFAVDEAYSDDATSGDVVLQQLPLHTMQIGDSNETKSTKNGFSDRGSIFSDGGESQLSNFTSCTNPTFDPVHRVWKSGSLLQKEVLAVLAATAELIKEKNGTESDAEYFAALLTAIEATPTNAESRLAASAYLLGLVAKKVDKSVLRKCFSRAYQILEGKLTGTDSDIALTKIISALGTILQHQAACVWQSSNTRLSLVKIGMFVLHNKAIVRSAVRHVLHSILTDPVMALSDGCHPAAGVVGEFLIKQIEQSAGNQDIELLVRLLCLAENIMHKMPTTVFKSFAESVLALLSVPNSGLRCAIYQCFYRTLQQQPADTSLPFDINVQLICVLRDFTPSVSDPSVTTFWIQALCESHVCLAAKDLSKSRAVLKASLKPIIQTFDLGTDSVAIVTCKVVARLAERCVQSDGELATYCVDLCDEALNPRSVLVWRHVLRAESKIFEVCKNAICSESLDRALKTLASLRLDDHCSVKADIDLTVGAAVRYVGVAEVLRALPLNLDPKNPAQTVQFERSWLMPILRVNISKQPIALALHYFLPLAHELRKVPCEAEVKKIFVTISYQLWGLLPSFLSSAIDFEPCFPNLAPIMGKTLHGEKDLRLIVLSSLRSALRFTLQPDAPEERKDVMRRFAYSFLRELFSLYTVSDATMESVEGTSGNSLKTLRYSILETVRLYMDLTPRDVIDNFTNLAVEKTQIKSMSLDQKIRVLDLMAALVRNASVTGLSSIFSTIHPWFITTEAALQKKAFRILEEIFKRLTDKTVAEFFLSYADEINNILDQDMNSVAMSARAAVLSVYQSHLLSLSSFEGIEQFEKAFLMRIILCFDKANNIRTRSNALSCFVKLCQQLILYGSDESKSPSNVLHPVLEIIFGMINPSQGAQSQEVSLEIARSTTIALNVIAQKFVRVLDASLLSRLIAHACSWICDGRPAVRILVIRLLRMLSKKLPDYTMQQYQELLLSAVFDGQLTADVTQKVRKANRLLLEVLVDRYGVEVLANRTDKSDWLKQLKSIGKIRRRKERRALEKQQENMTKDVDDDSAVSMTTTARTAGADTILDMLGDSDNEDDMEMEVDQKSLGGRTRGSSVWLKNDDDDDDVMDLLDRNTMLKKIATTRPDLSKSKELRTVENKGDVENSGGFKLAKDGRLIIEDLDLDESNKRKRKSFAEALDISDKKLKKDGESEVADNEDGGSDIKTLVSNKSGWKPGGRGIHRDVRRDRADDRSDGTSSKKKRKGAGDVRRKGEKYEPYAYIPFSKLKGQKKTELKKLIKSSKKGGVK